MEININININIGAKSIFVASTTYNIMVVNTAFIHVACEPGQHRCCEPGQHRCCEPGQHRCLSGKSGGSTPSVRKRTKSCLSGKSGGCPPPKIIRFLNFSEATFFTSDTLTDASPDPTRARLPMQSRSRIHTQYSPPMCLDPHLTSAHPDTRSHWCLHVHADASPHAARTLMSTRRSKLKSKPLFLVFVNWKSTKYVILLYVFVNWKSTKYVIVF